MEVPNRQVLHPIVKVFPVETTIIHAPSVAIRSLPRRIRGHEGAKLLPLRLGFLVIVAHAVIVLIRTDPLRLAGMSANPTHPGIGLNLHSVRKLVRSPLEMNAVNS